MQKSTALALADSGFQPSASDLGSDFCAQLQETPFCVLNPIVLRVLVVARVGETRGLCWGARTKLVEYWFGEC